jgi:microcystin-dependent protein
MSTGNGNGYAGTNPNEAPLRPARETTNLRLPVPGDANPADFVTDIGAIADIIDALQMTGIIGADPGDIKMTGAQTAPEGWLLCNGQAVSRTVFSDLFDRIGTTFGAGNQTTTFNVPDLRGRFPVGAADGAGVGQRGGADTVTLTIGQMPNHDHGGGTGQSGGGASGTWGGETGSGGGGGGGGGSGSTSAGGDHSHSVSGTVASHTHGTGGGVMGLTAATGATGWGTFLAGGGGATGAAAPGLSGNTGSGGNHSHSFSVSVGAAPAHTHSVPSHAHQIPVTGLTVNAQGGGTSHENRPPYIGVNFLIKT